MSLPGSASASTPKESQPSSPPLPPSSPATSSIHSLPSTTASYDSTDSFEPEISDAEQQWRESIQQLELLLTLVLVPYAGKYFGRRAAYWAWGRYMEWLYPVEVVVKSPGVFKGAGAIEAATL